MYKLNYNNYILENSNKITITKIEGLGLPNVRVSSQVTTGANGGNVYETKYGMRTIEIEGTIHCFDFDDYYNTRQELLNAFSINTNNNLVITRPDNVDFTLEKAFVVFGTSLNESTGTIFESDFRIELMSGEIGFGKGGIITITQSLTMGGGSPVPSPVPTPVTGDSGMFMIDYEGSIATNPIIEITGNILNPSLLNSTTGKQFFINRQINVGDTYLIFKDASGFYATYNGISDILNFNGEFVELVQGINSLVFNGSSFDTTATIKLTYYNKFLNV